MKDVIVIIGPTAVGKTKLSIELAKRLDAEIINGDSVAVYKKLDIGSAKPTVEERGGIIHHLLDCKDPTTNYSVYDYQKEGRKILEELNAKGKRVIIVGGTGLYIKALLYNYQFTEGTTENQYEELTNDEIYEKVKQYDEGVKVERNNRKRLVRLLNKYQNHEEIGTKKDEKLYPCKIIGLTVNRKTLYERIDKRAEQMVKDGLVEEVNSLKDLYKNSRILNNAIGYKEFVPYFAKEISLEEVIEKIKQDSRNYAKRQYTFFNHQFDTKWFEVHLEDFDKTIEEVVQYIESGK